MEYRGSAWLAQYRSRSSLVSGPGVCHCTVTWPSLAAPGTQAPEVDGHPDLCPPGRWTATDGSSAWGQGRPAAGSQEVLDVRVTLHLQSSTPLIGDIIGHNGMLLISDDVASLISY